MAQPGSTLPHMNGNTASSLPVVETEHLIVGAGPAGGSLACFLGQHGLKGIVITAASGTAETPRAHITNMAALECLRDIGLEEECVNAATKGDSMMHTRWCHSMAGEEYARIYSWGNDPARKGDYDAASPCNHIDLPQTLLEPILLKKATHSGFALRFNTIFLSFTKDPATGHITSTVLDTLTGTTYLIKSTYLYACDGARSTIVRQLGIPLLKKPGQGLAINILVEADLSHLVEQRKGNLHWVLQPDRESPVWGWGAIVRMVRPWKEWMFIVFPRPGAEGVLDVEPTAEEYLTRVREMIGDESVKVRVKDVSKWWIHETVAERYQEGNVFALGDATHRHPPTNGLGSNTCIQDAYNLAWKIALVTRSLASASLLSTFTAERQPVGLGVITRANQGLRDHFPIWAALGALLPTLEERKTAFRELAEASEGGKRRRGMLREGVRGTKREFHALGTEMGMRYESDAIYSYDEDEDEKDIPQPTDTDITPDDLILTYLPTTTPGSRLPHAWLNTRVPTSQISTHDLAGHTSFTLFTSIGGSAWISAATSISDKLGVQIRAVAIGWHCEYEDVYGDWAVRSGVEEDGCVLVRPDRFVCWRARGMVGDPVGRLGVVMRRVLGWGEEEGKGV